MHTIICFILKNVCFQVLHRAVVEFSGLLEGELGLKAFVTAPTISSLLNKYFRWKYLTGTKPSHGAVITVTFFFAFQTISKCVPYRSGDT